MTTPSYTIRRVCEKHLREIFWQERLWERYFMGELNIVFKTPKPKRFRDLTGREVAWSQELLFIDPTKGGIEVVRAHWYLDANFEPAGSGQPDPKDILIKDVNFRLWRIGDAPCAMCSLIARFGMHFKNLRHRIRNSINRALSISPVFFLDAA